eukprot:gnl/Hemi2/10692_TR3669_c0_g1_i1.p2 gnl/Hemi2/10692_TR3669_c0_g1~~gnl/Hemi2/10692_TR3669_c0_g1_i1.p2  ORF type:complete len:205 (-),score=89.84 gnl/Hemi2/10692_TR3669_c0_g1_i1:311-925(-)
MTDKNAVDLQDDESDEEEFVVERIVDSKRKGKNGKVHYLIKWANYPEADNSWEVCDNVHAPELIAEYEARVKGTEVKKETPKAAKAAKSSGKEEATTPSATAPKRGRPSPAATKTPPAKKANTRDTDVEQTAHNLAAMKTGGAPVPTDITSAKREGTELFHFVQWSNRTESWVPATKMNKDHPDLVIRFYESRLRFETQAKKDA